MLYTRTFKVLVLLVLFLVVVIYGWRNQWFGSGGIKGGLWQAVPENACLVIESSGWASLEAKTGTLAYAAGLDQALLADRLQLIFRELAGITGGKPGMHDLPFLASYHLARVGELDVLMLFEDKAAAKACVRGLKKKMGGGIATKYEYKRREIYVMTDSLGQKLTVSVVGDLVLASYTPFLVEDALAQLIVGNNLIADAHDQLSQKVKSSGQLKVLFYYPNMPLWLGGFMPPELVREHNAWGKFANASYFDITLKADVLLAEGATMVSSGDGLEQYNRISGMPAVPAATASVRLFNFTAAPNNRLERLFSRWFSGNGWVVEQVSLAGNKPGKVLWLTSGENASRTDTLLSYLNITLPENAAAVSMLKIPAGWQNRVLGKFYFKADSLWMWIADEGHVMLSDSETSLQSWQWAAGQDLLATDDFRPDKSSFGFWHRDIIQSNGANTPASTVNYALLRQEITDLSFFVKDTGVIRPTVLRIQMQPEKPVAQLIPLWTNNTASSVLRGPFAVTDTNGKMLIAAQDSLKDLYVWNADGKLLFKKNLEGLIAGEVYGVDYHNNKQLQLMFATPKMVHCLNAKGQETGGYPLKLSGTAAYLTLTGRTSRAKFYVTATSGDIYGFEMTGRPLQGYSPLRANALTDAPVLRGKNGNIIVATRDNQLRSWQPDSKPAWSVKLPGGLLELPVMTEADTLGTVVQAVLQGGTLVYVSQDGTLFNRGSISAQPKSSGIVGTTHTWTYTEGQLSLNLMQQDAPLWQQPLPGQPQQVIKATVVGDYLGVHSEKGLVWMSMADGKPVTGRTISADNLSFFSLANKDNLHGAVLSPGGRQVHLWLLSGN